ncbi:lysozyme [Octopus bimaculoides]|uniref:lysozyme n=1 Tax=Octopus bimaculoides TaxID=37653 RepID=A0A0L8HXE4_OCTBM|nr:lysozyme [Octopus bimaculoides]|eukprot:XP_014768593.1 PREDICTED: lysozyme-like [Octopus bimaculoides]
MFSFSVYNYFLVVVLYLITTECSTTFAPGIVPAKCLQCLCDIETKCKPADCYGGDGPITCGYFQISKAFYDACGSPGSSWQQCTKDKYCSTLCVQNYMNKYINNCVQPNCLNFARLHFGGPSGCANPNTLLFALRVNKCSES